MAKSLQDAGHEVLYIGCDGVLSDGVCVSMRVAVADFDSDMERKKHICGNCTKNKATITNAFGFKEEALGSYLNSEDFEFVDSELKKVAQENFFSYTFDGLPIGRIAVYEVMMQFKKNSFNFTDEEFLKYKAWLKNAMFVAIAAKKILSQHSPDRLLIYNNLYSANHAFHAIAKKIGIPSYSMHAWDNFGSLCQALFLTHGSGFDYMYGTVELWKDYKNHPVNKRTMTYVKEHHKSIMTAKTVFTYSESKRDTHVNIKEYFGVPADSRVVFALMSSYDEIYAAYAIGAYATHEPKIYKNQVLWLKDLIDFFSKREDLFLIIRVHPREFPNRREGRKSENATVYEELLSNLPNNIKVNMPSDNLSIYDLALYSDVVLNGFSSAGLEMALLGLPVLSYGNDWNTYPVELDYHTENKDEYLKAIDTLLDTGWSADRIKMAYRWLAFKFGYTSFYIGDAFDYKQGEKVNQKHDLDSLPNKIASADKMVDFVDSGKQIYIDMQMIQCEQNIDDEDVIIKEYMKEVYDFLFSDVSFELPILGQRMKAYLDGFKLSAQ